MSLHAPGPAHSAAVSSFEIGNRAWKIGDTIEIIGTKVIEKRKMVETYGAQCEIGRAEGVFLGRSTIKKFRLRWANLKNPAKSEHGGSHFWSKIWSKVRAQNEQNIGVPDIPAPFAPGFVIAVSNSKDVSDQYPSDPEVSESDDVNRLSAGI